MRTPWFADRWRGSAPSWRGAPFFGGKFLERTTLHPFRNRLEVPGDPLVLRRRHEFRVSSLLNNLAGAVELARESRDFGVGRRGSVLGRVSLCQTVQSLTKSLRRVGQLSKVLCILP